MDPPLQPRMGPNIPIAHLNPFQPDPSFDPYRPIDNIAPQPLQPFPPQQGAIALENNPHVPPNNGLDLLQPADQLQQSSSGAVPTSVPFAGSWEGVEFIPSPPSLEHWRNELFHLETPITFSEEQYANCPSRFFTYFPHIDNVYTLRSSQRQRRKPSVVVHYYHCRLKGRAAGTPKSTDPNKKNRNRTARERDLCDARIKVIEFLPTAAAPNPSYQFESFATEILPGYATEPASNFGILTPNNTLPSDHPGANGGRYFVIERVNADDDSETVLHQHTLEESDRIKKNTVQRTILKQERERKKAVTQAMATDGQQKTYSKNATGQAAITVTNHSAESNLKLFGSCFCPFVQRVWIALELKGIPYQYIEVDPYQKPQSLLEVNPRGLVPALRHNDWGCYESTVLMEYLKDLNLGASLLPADPQLRAHCRLWADHVNRKIVPGFYRLLQEQNQEKQVTYAQGLQNDLNHLITAAHPHGPFFMGLQISFVDVQAAPWIIRLQLVLKPYRGWPDPEEGSRWASWVNAITTHEDVRATTSTDELYLDSYQRYAQNRPNTSQLANAINSGHSLP